MRPHRIIVSAFALIIDFGIFLQQNKTKVDLHISFLLFYFNYFTFYNTFVNPILNLNILILHYTAPLHRSMVGFKESRSMGETAQISTHSNYKNTITTMKRLIGLPFTSPRAQAEMKRAPFKCLPISHSSGGPDSVAVSVQLNNEEVILPIEAVAGMLIKHMGDIVAEKSAETSNADKKDFFPNDWVIAIPGFYNDAQRRALLAGCQIAGIEGVQMLMHEHTAAALAYGISKDRRKEFTKDEQTHVMFLDIGNSSYSCSIVSFEPGKLFVKSAHFDENLGGREFDLKIAEWIAETFEKKHKGKFSGKVMDRPKTVIKLLSAAEKAKKTLSPAGVKEARLHIEMLMDDLDFNATLTAKEYEEMCDPLLARLNPPIQAALAETGLSPKDLSSIEIVGGGSRVGCVKRTLAKILGLNVSATNNGLSTTMNADEAVARGAALQSAILSPNVKALPYEIVEAQPFPVKISWERDASEPVAAEGEGDEAKNSSVMFERNSNLNVVRRVTLLRSGEFVVAAAYDESAYKYNYHQGQSKDIVQFKIKAPEGNDNKIRVNVKQDISGCIHLSSVQMVEEIEEGEGEEAKPANLEFTEIRPMAWTKEEMDVSSKKEVAMTNVDRVVKETANMRNDLESYVYDMRDKIISESQLAPYVTEDEKNAFSSLLETTENWLHEEGCDATKSVYAGKLQALKVCGAPIEYRRQECKTRLNPTATNNAIVPSTARRRPRPRPLVGRGSIGAAFLSDTGKFFSRSTKTVTNVAKDVAGKSQRTAAKTKKSALVAKNNLRKLDEKIDFTGAVTEIAALKAAHDFVHGRKKSGTVALGIAGAGLATKHHFKQDRDRENNNNTSNC